MTKEQQEILEQDRKDTQEYIDSLSQEELDNIPVKEDLVSEEELQELQDSLDILLEQYTSNLDEIEKYKDILRENIEDLISVTEDRETYIFDIDYIKPIKILLKQLNKENKTLLKEIQSLEFDISYYAQSTQDIEPIITEEQATDLDKDMKNTKTFIK